VNFSQDDAEILQDGGTPAKDDKLVAELVTQSNLLSGGVEDRFVAYLFADSDEIDRIRHLELCANIKILPENFEPMTKTEIIEDPAEDNDSEEDSLMINTKEKVVKATPLAKSVPMPEPKLDLDKVLFDVLRECQNISFEKMVLAMQFAKIPAHVRNNKTTQRKMLIMIELRKNNKGQENGMILTRSAFSVMIKMSGRSEQLRDLIEDFEMESEGVDDQEALSELFEGLPGSKEILEQWSNASKMRPWYDELIKDIGEDVNNENEEKEQEEINKISSGVKEENFTNEQRDAICDLQVLQT
jgi:hypothetical protein